MRDARTWHRHCLGRLEPVPQSKLIAPPRWLAVASLVLLCACAEIPKQRYGIDQLQLNGMKELDTNALRACLTTEQREKVTLGVGALLGGSCGEPPFDKTRWAGRLFALPWTDWPVYDEAVLKLDLERIERWYQARGFYGVRVLDVKFKPDAARTTDACRGDDCKLEISVNIDEGEPVRVRKLKVQVEGKIEPALQKRIDKALTLQKGDVFDEASYDVGITELAKVLREAGYARVEIHGDITINRGLLIADVTFNITPGPLCRFGEVRLVRKGDFPEAPVRAVTQLKKGQLYRESALEDAQRSIFALGAFSSVTVRGDLRKTTGAEVPVVIELEAKRESAISVGAGIMSGSASGNAADEGISIPQWDVHLLGSYENRNFVGGLRRFRIEERPRLLFLGPFPTNPDGGPRFGNTINANFSQPGIIDARTNLFVETRWDNGPDPFLLFFRNDVGVALGLERGFFRQRLNARIGVHQEFMEVSSRQPIVEDVKADLNAKYTEQYDLMPLPKMAVQVTDQQAAFYELPSSYRLPFIEQRLTLDLRNDVTKPSKGAFFKMIAHEALRPGSGSQPGEDPKYADSTWNYLRLTPEARGYVPVGLGIVLAARFAVGWIGILNAGRKLDEQSKLLGPQAYRLRGGGAMSNRGFGPGELGDGRTGGTHRWEASLELRIPLSKNFYLVGFSDMGDVNAGFDIERTFDPTRPDQTPPSESFQSDIHLRPHDQRGFRWNHPNTAFGGGLRYYTVIGPVRLDVGARPRKFLQLESDDNYTMDLGFTSFRGAVHLTIGDAF